ncbi:MAG: VanW family protein [Candidatus Uhrbacteria bacterium]
MNLEKLKDDLCAPPENKQVFSKPLKIGLIVGVVVIFIGYAGAFVWAQSYNHRLAPNVWIGNVKVGGGDFETAKQTINATVDKILLDGIQLSVDGKLGTVPLSPVGSEVGDYVIFDVNNVIDSATKLHHSTTPSLQPFTLLYSLTHKSHLQIPIQINENQLKSAVLNTFPGSIQPATNAGFAFAKTDEVWKASVTPSASGLTIPTDEFFTRLQTLLANLDPQPIVLSRSNEEPTIKEPTVSQLLVSAENTIAAAPFTLTYNDQTWNLEAETLISALKPALDENNQPVLSVSVDGLKTLLDEIATTVEKPTMDARLTMENGRVTEFQGSSNGISIDREATVLVLSKIINEAAQSGIKTSELVIQTVEPTIKMESVNDLGIKEVLGVGISDYSNSPTNRIKNIRNGVRLLNGLLIKPGEEFSLISALKPITLDNGYLSELVIKGDKIEPEIGGGLCQIGTTAFRAAMNSGLPITARNNHSLVINHYVDPINGNPGTDATIYDPAPDLKFINDTGNYILFQAEMDETNSLLYFSFWGTSDGRKGSYPPPTLIRWIGVGPEQVTETTDLEPGVKKCQNAFVGADATFTYTIEKADGTKTETVFDSHYRPLPKICLLGVEKLTEPVVEGTEAVEPVEGTVPEVIPEVVPEPIVPVTE